MSTQKVVETSQSPEPQEKKDRKKHQEKKVKHERPAQYERNADLITVDTVLPPLPKKNEILVRPNIKDYQQREGKNKQKISKLIQKKKQLYDQKFKPNKPLVKGEGGIHSEFKNQIQDFNDLKDRFKDVAKQRNAKRDLLTHLIEEAKENNALIKKLKQAAKNSRENYEAQLEKLEHKLITSELSKKDEANLNAEIATIKRKIKDAEPAGNVEVRIEKAQQRKEELDAQIQKVKQDKEPLQQECKELKQQMDTKNEVINKIKGDIKNEKNEKNQAQVKHDKQYDDWKANKQKRIEEVNEKIKALDNENKNVWKEYKEKNQAYWEQKHKLDFLQWQHRVKERKIRDVQREKRRAVAEQKEKQREKEEQLQKYIKEIELCNYLTNYLRELQTDTTKEQKQQQKAQQPKDINAKLDEDAQWKKEKGLVILQSKKSKEDEEPVKKGGKKNKKKGEKVEQSTAKKFEIPFNIQLLFDNIKVLPPESLEQIDKKIGELKERQTLFQRACSQEVSEQDKKIIDKIKGLQKKEKKETAQKKEEEDFPTL